MRNSSYFLSVRRNQERQRLLTSRPLKRMCARVFECVYTSLWHTLYVYSAFSLVRAYFEFFNQLSYPHIDYYSGNHKSQ